MGNSANGDNTQRGDGEGQAFFSTAYGCVSTKYYHDYDGDRYGAVASGYTMNCSLPQSYAADDGDAMTTPRPSIRAPRSFVTARTTTATARSTKASSS